MKRNMQTDHTTPTHTSLAETLENALASEHQGGPSIGELTDAVGEKGFGLVLVLLSLPSALPVPAPVPVLVLVSVVGPRVFRAPFTASA